MAADTLKSASITNLDSDPIVANTSPNGASHRVQRVSDSVTPTTGGLVATTSTYKMVRVPTNCYVKHIHLFADSALDTNATPTLAVDIGAYYSDSTKDGTSQANQGAKVGGNDNQFADNYLLKAQTAAMNVEAGTWTQASRTTLLWSSLGLTKDPGGAFDIVITVEAAAATAASAVMTLEAEYVMP